MGQPITVVSRPSRTPGIIRYETNRALSGMGHERYASVDDVVDDRPVDVLARRILEHGGVDSVHINSNIITVRLLPGSQGEGLDDIIGDLYLFYGHPENQGPGELEAALSPDDTTAADPPEDVKAPQPESATEAAPDDPAAG